MKSFVFAVILVLTFCVTALCQATGSVGVSFPVAEQGGVQADDLGVNFAGGYWFADRFFIGAEAFTNDGFGSRYRLGGLGRAPFGNFKVDVGGGFWCFVRCSDNAPGSWGGYGQLGLHYDRVHGFGRIGNDRFLEAELALDVARFADDKINIQVFARGTRHELPVIPNLTQTVYPVGIRVVFGGPEKYEPQPLPVQPTKPCGSPNPLCK